MQATENERKAYEWAVANQGYSGTYEEWLAMPDSERRQYELGAAGIPTS